MARRQPSWIALAAGGVLIALYSAAFVGARPTPPPVIPDSAETPTSVEALDQAFALDPCYLSLLDEHGMNVLHRVVVRGDAAVVKRILDLGGDANAKTGDGGHKGAGGNTPLMMTCFGAVQDAMYRGFPPKDLPADAPKLTPREWEQKTRGRPDPVRGPMQFAEVAKLLLAHSADAKATNSEGLTPLHIAAQSANAELISIVLAAKVDVDAVSHPQSLLPETPLVDAAGTGDIEAVRTLLDAGADPAKVPAETRRSFAMQAMRDVGVFRLLLDRGMVLPDRALAMATRNNRTDIAAEIIKRGKAADQDGALYAAIENKTRYELTDEQEADLVSMVKTLLDAGASPSAPEGTGEAVVAAIVDGHEPVAKLLEERGAKVDWARMKKNAHAPEAIAYGMFFTHHIERLEACEAMGMPLGELGASILGKADRLASLIKADPTHVAGKAGSTALYLAASYGRIDCVKLLLDAGTDPNERMPSWDTPDIGPRPVEGAAVGGHLPIVKLLLDRGADPKLLNFDDEDWAKLSPALRELLSAAQHP